MNSDSQEQDPRKIQNLLQCFSIEGLKTKTKLSQRPIRWKENNFKSQWELKLDTIKLPKARENAGKRGKTRVTKSWLVLLLHLIGWKSGASFLGKSQSKVKQN